MWAAVLLAACGPLPDRDPVDDMFLFNWHRFGLQVTPVDAPEPGRCYDVAGTRACFRELGDEGIQWGVRTDPVFGPFAEVHEGSVRVTVYGADPDHARRLLSVGNEDRSLWPGRPWSGFPVPPRLRWLYWRRP